LSEKFEPPEGWGTTGETAKFCNTSKSKLGQYRNRDWFLEELWHQDGQTIYYDMKATQDLLDEKVDQRHRKLGSVKVEKELMKMGIPSKDISDARSKFYEAEEKRIKFEKVRGNLIEKDPLKKYLGKTAIDLKETLYTIPDRLAPQLIAMTYQIEIANLIRDEIDNSVVNLFRTFLEDEEEEL